MVAEPGRHLEADREVVPGREGVVVVDGVVVSGHGHVLDLVVVARGELRGAAPERGRDPPARGGLDLDRVPLALAPVVVGHQHFGRTRDDDLLALGVGAGELVDAALGRRLGVGKALQKAELDAHLGAAVGERLEAADLQRPEEHRSDASSGNAGNRGGAPKEKRAEKAKAPPEMAAPMPVRIRGRG